MSTQQSASRMGHLAECGLQGWVGVSEKFCVYVLSGSLSHTSDSQKNLCQSFIRSLLFWKHQAFQMWPSTEPTCVKDGECN